MTNPGSGTQQAIPPLRFTEASRRHSTCVCGRKIKTSGFGWVHEDTGWVRSGLCLDAQPAAGR